MDTEMKLVSDILNIKFDQDHLKIICSAMRKKPSQNRLYLALKIYNNRMRMRIYLNYSFKEM